MTANDMANGLSEWVKYYSAHAAPGLLAPCATTQKGFLMPLRESEQAIFLILKDAATNLRFFDLPDGKKLVWMLQRALQVGFDMGSRRKDTAITKAKSPRHAKSKARTRAQQKR